MAPPDPRIEAFIKKHFVRKEKLAGSSNRWKYECVYCPQDRKEAMVHRDGRLLQHSFRDCEHCPPGVKNEAGVLLMSRAGAGKLETLPSMAASSTSGSSSPADENISESGSRQPKRPRADTAQSSVAAFLDRPMTPAETEKANLSLLRCVVLFRTEWIID